jgi:ZIP family zinc transporter
MGLFSALAIAIHNIPEGIAVSVPIYYATKNRKKPFGYPFYPD